MCCQGRLTQLYLPSAGLECAFPAALAQLTELTALDLTFNRLSGRCAATPRDLALCLSEPGCMTAAGRRAVRTLGRAERMRRWLRCSWQTCG